MLRLGRTCNLMQPSVPGRVVFARAFDRGTARGDNPLGCDLQRSRLGARLSIGIVMSVPRGTVC